MLSSALLGALLLAVVTTIPPVQAALVTQQQLRILWANNPQFATDEAAAEFSEALAADEINTLPRVRHFMSQVAHESGQGRYVQEIWGPNRWQVTYQGRMGNNLAGDGYRYRGAGYIQLTGKNNYRAFANFVKDPRVMEGCGYVSVKYPARSATYWWTNNNMNAYVDGGRSVSAVTYRVNGGQNGLADRQDMYQRALRAWPDGSTLDDGGYKSQAKCDRCRKYGGGKACDEICPAPSPPPPPADACRFGQAGRCIDTAASSCDGATTLTGYCAGKAQIQCCPPPGTVSKRPARAGPACRGVSGSCIDTTALSCAGGNLLYGRCPGESAIMCCEAPGKPSSSLPKAPAPFTCRGTRSDNGVTHDDDDDSGHPFGSGQCTIVNPNIAVQNFPIKGAVSHSQEDGQLTVAVAENMERAKAFATTVGAKGQGAMQVAKTTLAELFSHRRGRRGIVDSWERSLLQGFMSQFWDKIKNNPYVKCGVEIHNVVLDIYRASQDGVESFGSILDIVKHFAITTIDCLHAFGVDETDDDAKGWQKWVVRVAEVLIHTPDIYSSCKPIYDMIESRTIEWFKIGSRMATCAKALNIKRKQRQLASGGSALNLHGLKVPAAWSCDPDWFGDAHVCDSGCGDVLDVDCGDVGVTETYVKLTKDDATIGAPPGWTCPREFYHGADGCDVCGDSGVVDPDCLDEDRVELEQRGSAGNVTRRQSATRHDFKWESPALYFNVEHRNLMVQVHEGSSISDACTEHFRVSTGAVTDDDGSGALELDAAETDASNLGGAAATSAITSTPAALMLTKAAGKAATMDRGNGSDDDAWPLKVAVAVLSLLLAVAVAVIGMLVYHSRAALLRPTSRHRNPYAPAKQNGEFDSAAAALGAAAPVYAVPHTSGAVIGVSKGTSGEV